MQQQQQWSAVTAALATDGLQATVRMTSVHVRVWVYLKARIVKVRWRSENVPSPVQPSHTTCH